MKLQPTGMIYTMSVKYGSISLTIKTLSCKFFGIPDFQRWADLNEHDPGWDERTRLIAKRIPQGSRVIEFGAGRRQLELYLEPACVYVPSDLVSRGPDTIVCDLNTQPFPELGNLNLDVAVFGGVLEYIRDLHTLVDWLSKQISICVVSYVCAQSKPKTLYRFREIAERTSFGWVNTYSADELQCVFKTNGFPNAEMFVEQTSYGDEYIFVFKR